MVRIVDLSVSLENFSSEYHSTAIEYIDHYDFARKTAKTWGLDPAAFPEPYVGGATEEITATSHAGTHVDAPWHFGPMTAGHHARTIDEIPLEWCYGDGVTLDFSMLKATGDYITSKDIGQQLQEFDYELKPGDILLIRTGAGDHWGEFEYPELGAGLSGEAVFWLVERGIRMIATDAYSLDIPIHLMAERLKSGDADAFFPVHRAGREVEYVHAEKLTNLQMLPFNGYKVAMFPVKIRRGSGAWCRAVAIFDP